MVKAVASKNKARWKAAVGTFQYGIATTAGVEAVQAGTKLYLQCNNQSAVLLLDGRNAYNSCDRQQFLNQLYQEMPELSPFIEQWYVGEAPLWYHMEDGSTRTLVSSEGAQQGDPDGGFLFCLGAAPKLRCIAQSFPNVFIGAIIDDVTIAAPIPHLSEIITVASRSLGEYGIDLVPQKCLIYTAPEDASLIPAEVPSNFQRSTEGYKLLGSPHSQAREYTDHLVPEGGRGYMANWLNTQKIKLQDFCLKTLKIRNTQAAFQMLLLSANNKTAHLLRSISTMETTAVFGDFVQEFDDMILHTFQEIFSCHNLSENQAVQIRLPERLSGLGLLGASQMAMPAYIGSARQSVYMNS